MGGPNARATSAYDRALLEALDSLAADDDQWGGVLHLTVARRLVELVAPRPGDSCLDVGGGDGAVAGALAAAVKGGTVVSVDLRLRTLTSAGAAPLALANTHRVRGDRDEIIFRDNTFDVVVLSRSIAYEQDAGMIVVEASRTLKVGGRIALFCRRRGLATVAEQAYLDLLESFVDKSGINLPARFLAYPGWADRRQVDIVLRSLGFDDCVFGDVVTGGRAAGAADWNREMAAIWPAARIVVNAIGGRTRTAFEARVDTLMHLLGEDGYRFHHPYLLVAATKRRDTVTTGAAPPPPG